MDWIEGLFIDRSKTDEIHRIKNEVTSVKVNIEFANRQLQRKVKNTTAYRVAQATGNL